MEHKIRNKLLSHVKIGKFITFGDIEIEKLKFHRYKDSIFLNNLNEENIITSVMQRNIKLTRSV